MSSSQRLSLLLALTVTASLSQTARAQYFTAGDLLVSSSTYAGDASTLAVGQALPNTNGSHATSNGVYSTSGVFTNDAVDPNFGVTAPITISQLTTTGLSTGVSINLDPSLYGSTSFASKSELGLNLSTDGTSITLMDYAAPANQIDISNANTPGITEPGNTDIAASTYRQVVQINADGSVNATTTNAYNGNNGRNAILNSSTGLYYTVGNAGNGNGSTATTNATGVQIVTPGVNATSATPGTTQAGEYSVTENGYAADKTAKDNNFRGATIFNGGLYVTKGSGSNGINTVYQVGTTGNIPTANNNTAGDGTISVLPGFSTVLAKASSGVQHPFGLFFANASTLYVADEGNGAIADETNPGTSNQYAGLQKWTLSGNTWHLNYILKTGLNLGQAYTVNGSSGGASGSYTAFTDGLRNLTGRVNSDGTVSLFSVTSTVDNYTNQDFGADPNQLVAITDLLANTDSSVASAESFTTLQTANYGQVLRGVAFTPQALAAPEPSSWALALLAFGGVVAVRAYRRQLTR